MNDWHNLKIKGIARIGKCVAEFNVKEINKTPYSKFRVRIYEDSTRSFIGYTNLITKDGDEGVGYGNTIEEALEDTVLYFLKISTVFGQKFLQVHFS